MTAWRRIGSRAYPLAAVAASSLLTACYYGLSPDATAPLPITEAAPASRAAVQPRITYRAAVSRAAASVVSVYAAGQLWQDGVETDIQTLTVGSGVILDRSGFIVTTGPGLPRAQRLVVGRADGTACEAILIGFDARSGIGVLKIDAVNLDPIELGNMSDVAVGDIVLAIGNPPGVGQTVSQGIVGAIGRKHNGIEGYIETDATIPPGGFGGALVDSAGRLIGITSASVAIGDEQPGIRLAVPVDRMQEIVARLKKRGRDA